MGVEVFEKRNQSVFEAFSADMRGTNGFVQTFKEEVLGLRVKRLLASSPRRYD